MNKTELGTREAYGVNVAQDIKLYLETLNATFEIMVKAFKDGEKAPEGFENSFKHKMNTKYFIEDFDNMWWESGIREHRLEILGKQLQWERELRDSKEVK